MARVAGFWNWLPFYLACVTTHARRGFPPGLQAACGQNCEKGSAFACSGRGGLRTHARPAAASWFPRRPHPQPEPHARSGFLESGFILCAFPANGCFKPGQTLRFWTPHSSTLHTEHCRLDRRQESKAMCWFWKSEDGVRDPIWQERQQDQGPG